LDLLILTMSTKDYLPLPVPDKTFPVTESLTDVQQEVYKNVLAHFSKPHYKLPGVKDNHELMEQEQFWLVWYS
jgi:hypothetical protein